MKKQLIQLITSTILFILIMGWNISFTRAETSNNIGVKMGDLYKYSFYEKTGTLEVTQTISMEILNITNKGNYNQIYVKFTAIENGSSIIKNWNISVENPEVITKALEDSGFYLFRTAMNISSFQNWVQNRNMLPKRMSISDGDLGYRLEFDINGVLKRMDAKIKVIYYLDINMTSTREETFQINIKRIESWDLIIEIGFGILVGIVIVVNLISRSKKETKKKVFPKPI